MKKNTAKLIEWLDDRTGLRALLHEALYERVPGGARWRYVWGSTLVVALLTQMITGTFLWMAYSPSTQTAWESVFYIQYEMAGGWLLRGIHHYMAAAMVVLLAIHFAQVVWDGAYRAPRELNFVLGLVLMLLVLGLSLTGYLLPWDQKGYWATNVGTELVSQAPLVGGALKKLAVGGTIYGHHTLTRFLALHAGVLPAALVAFVVIHVALFRRHGVTPKLPCRSDHAFFWPDQVLKDSVAALGVLVAVLVVTVYTGGAELMAPADPANNYAAARPEWYFLFLFQFLKWFPGDLEVWGAFVVPTLLLGLLFCLPWIGRSRAGHLGNVLLLVVLLGGVALLTAQALYEDHLAGTAAAEFADSGLADTAENRVAFRASQNFLRARQTAHHRAQRVIALAKARGIPPTGALTLVHEDPYLQGPELFAKHCASCHNYLNRAQPDPQLAFLNNPQPTAPNLYGVGSRAWIAGMLDPAQIVGPDYYGYRDSPFGPAGPHAEMVDFICEVGEELSGEEGPRIAEAMQKIGMALAAEAQLPSQAAWDVQDADTIAQGRALLEGGLGELLESGSNCTDCHTYGAQQDIGSPVLDGYMSRQWLLDFIRNPAAERFYGDLNDRMPAFAPHQDARFNQLDDKSLELIVDWLRGDWVRP